MIIISNFVSLLLLTYIANSFLKNNRSQKINIFTFFLSFITVSMLNHNGGSPLTATFILSIYSFYVFFLFSGKIINKLMIIIPFFIIQIISELIVGFCLGSISSLALTNTIFSFGYILGILLSNIMTAVLFVGYVHVLKVIRNDDIPKYTWSAFIIPVITIILIVHTDKDYFILYRTCQNGLLITIILALSNLIFFIIFILVINSSTTKQQLLIANQKEELINSKYNLLAQHYNYNFKFLHNLLHTCNDLNNEINNSNFEEAKRILNSLSETAYKEFNAIYSNSFLLNYIINNHLDTIIENNIDIKTVIEYSEFEKLDFNTQLDLFEFILELTIQKCLEVDDLKRVIIIKTKKQANHIIINIIFPAKEFDEQTIIIKLQNILNNLTFFATSKQMDSIYTSLLITFNS